MKACKHLPLRFPGLLIRRNGIVASGIHPVRLVSVFANTLLAVVLLMSCPGECAAQTHTYLFRFIGPETVVGNPVVQYLGNYSTKTEAQRGLVQLTKPGVDYEKFKRFRDVEVAFNDPQNQLSEVTAWIAMKDPAAEGKFGLEAKATGMEWKGFPVPPNGSVVVVRYDIEYNGKVDVGLPDGRLVDRPFQPKIRQVAASSVVFDKRLKYVEVKESPPFQVPDGAVERKREEYTVRHSVGVQKGTQVEGELRGKLGIVEASIKASIEHSTSTTYEESKTTSREVEIRGGKDPVKLVWFETYRTGKSITIVDGQTYEVPFEFREGWDLQSRIARDEK